MSKPAADANTPNQPKPEPPRGWRQMVREILRTLLVAAVIITVANAWQTRHHFKRGTPAPVFTVPGEWLGGVKGSDETAGPRLVYFFAPWCGVCRISAPTLNDLVNDGFAVSVVAADWEDEGVQSVADFASDVEWRMPIRLVDSAARDRWSVSSYPSWFVIGPDGTVVTSGVGWTSGFGFRWRLWWAKLS
jgi:thiol-disulfide isomerase/thioredoxin